MKRKYMFKPGLRFYGFLLILCQNNYSDFSRLALLHSERPKLYTILAFLSAIGLKRRTNTDEILLCKVIRRVHRCTSYPQVLMHLVK